MNFMILILSFKSLYLLIPIEFPSKGLAYLLKHFVGIEVNKKLQLADWRVRPLTKELVRYAQEDTHYLLYVYDRLHNAIIHQDQHEKSATMQSLMHVVLKQCQELSKKRYEKEIFTEQSYLRVYQKFNQALEEDQVSVHRLHVSMSAQITFMHLVENFPCSFCLA